MTPNWREWLGLLAFVFSPNFYFFSALFDMKSKDLPAEVLDLIFSILKDDEEIETVGQGVLVCKQWKAPAQRVYFSTITIDYQDEVDRLIQALKNNNSSPGVFTATLFYQIEDEDVETSRHSENIKVFVDLFPALHYLYWDQPTRDYYMIVTQAILVTKWT